MKNYGFIRVAAACPIGRIGDTDYNADVLARLIDQADQKQCSVLVFPELAVTSYTCGDLFFSATLLQGVVDALQKLKQATEGKSITVLVGAPISDGTKLFNAGVVISSGSILGVVPKTFLPNYGEFYEQRWFASADDLWADEIELCGEQVPIGTDLLFELGDAKIGVEICEDLWVNDPPSIRHAQAGANLICNLSASNAVIGKKEYRRVLVRQRSFCSHCGYIYASSGVSESTTDTLYSGDLLIGENGSIVASAMQERFEDLLVTADLDLERMMSDRRKMSTFNAEEDYRAIPVAHAMRRLDRLERPISQMPFVPKPSSNKNERMEEIYRTQALSLAQRLRHTGLQHPVIGISGGLDSTLALLVTVRAADILQIPRSNIFGITMPGFGTSDRTLNNSKRLIEALGVSFRQIDITEACLKHFQDIGHDPSDHDVTYENVQARERTQILLDIANKHAGLVVGTGDLSELALGWATYAGDHISMYGVNAGVPKTLVRHVVGYIGEINGGEIKEILEDILDTPVSPELLPPDEQGKIAQKTEEILGDYILHDFFLYYFVRFNFSFDKIQFLARHAFAGTYSDDEIKRCLEIFIRRFFSQQFKRSCLPDGPKIGSVTLSPRADWRMPSDSSAALWLREIET